MPERKSSPLHLLTAAMLCIYASLPLRLLASVQALTTIGDAAQARANAAPATASGRKLAQLPAANDPSKPAQPFGYR